MIDIFIVFSNQSHYEQFQLKDHIKPIIIDSHKNMLNTTLVHGNMLPSIVTHKKFSGLKQLMDSKYDYFIVCDSEIDIIPEHFTNDNILEKIKNIFTRKQLYAGDFHENTWGINITTNCAKLFKGDDYDKIRSITNNFKYYTWFSDIPVYRRTDLPGFFEKINDSDLNWYQFDHIIYQYYLIVTENYELINTSPITNQTGNSLEYLHINSEEILNKLADLGYGFGWLSKYTFDYHPTYFLAKKTFIIFHIDRK
jgi:hypothetical protein